MNVISWFVDLLPYRSRRRQRARASKFESSVSCLCI